MTTPKININTELDEVETYIDAFLKRAANQDKKRGQNHAKDAVERGERLRDDIKAERILLNTLLDRFFYEAKIARRADQSLTPAADNGETKKE